MFKSIRIRLALSFAGIALVAAVVLGAVLLTTLQNYYSSLELDYMRGNAKFISDFVTAADKAPHDEVQSQIENLAFLTQTRIQVYDTGGQLLYDSGAPHQVAVNLGVMKQLIAQSDGALPNATFRIIAVNPASGSAPAPGAKELFGSTAVPAPNEKGTIIYRSVQVAGSPFGFYLNGEAASARARSNQIVKQAIVDPKNGSVLGAVDLSEGPAYGRDILTNVAWGWALASAVAVLLAAGVGWFISRRISAPVLALTNATTLMAAGDLSSRAGIAGHDELGQLASSFNEMAHQVETTVVALRHFVSDAAHELNTPLTALRTNLDLAQTSEQADERAAFLQRAQTTVRRLEELNRNLLDLSRLEAAPKPSDAQTDIVALLEEMNEVYASRAEQAGLEFEMQVPPTPLLIRGDRVQVERAIGNLIDNAIKFTPEGGKISIQCSGSSEQCTVSVSDTGIGIPSEDLPQLFSRFHRGRNAIEYPGSGLGLAIVKAIMEQQGGQVSAENMQHGARMTLQWKRA